MRFMTLQAMEMTLPATDHALVCRASAPAQTDLAPSPHQQTAKQSALLSLGGSETRGRVGMGRGEVEGIISPSFDEPPLRDL